MKKSQLIIVGALLLIALAVGFVIGVSVDFPKPSGNDLGGTIGKLNNYRNVKLGEDDIQLRSDLLTNTVIRKQYQGYFAFHYTAVVKLGNNIDYALQVANQSGDFTSNYVEQIGALAEYAKILEVNRLDILLALQVIQNLSEKNQSGIGPVLNNAQMAIAQIKYKESVVIDFVEAIEIYLENAPDGYNQDLKKAHDLLVIVQAGQAIASNNKPAIKYFDNKELFGSYDDNLNVVVEVQSSSKLDAGYSAAPDILKSGDASFGSDIKLLQEMNLDNIEISSSKDELISLIDNYFGNFSIIESEMILHQIQTVESAGKVEGYDIIKSDISTFNSEIQTITNEFHNVSNSSNLDNLNYLPPTE